MKLSKKDRLLLINQFRILSRLMPTESGEYADLIEILECGYTIFYASLFEWLSKDMPEADGKLVLDILNLYRGIEDKKRSTQDDRLLSHRYAVFRGFDGNEETAFMVFARFLIEKQGKFQEQRSYLAKNDNLNSHEPLVGKYRAMLAAVKHPYAVLDMSVEDILKVLDAN